MSASNMADRPIIFSAPMVRALLSGRKTQTRRIIKPQPLQPFCGISTDGVKWWTNDEEAGVIEPLRVPCAEGDRLWVREAWGMGVSDHGDCPRYKATMDYKCGDKIKSEHEGPFKWRPSIHMPRWASRITMEVTAVKVERLQDINRGGAMEEGCPFPNMASGPNPLDWFRDLWTSIHGPGAWEANPWVAAISFTVERRNIDA